MTDEIRLLIEIGVVLAAAVWAVSKIGSTAERLGDRIEHLSGSVDKLNETLEKVEGKVNDHDGRLRVLEARDAG